MSKNISINDSPELEKGSLVEGASETVKETAPHSKEEHKTVSYFSLYRYGIVDFWVYKGPNI